MSLSLGIHTAGPFCGVALLEGDTLLAFREEKMRRGHDQFLPGLVQSVLDETGIAMGAIDRFSVCVGPGSFTGIRIGVAFARGLALANGEQAFGITSLEALVSKPQDRPVLSLIPAKLRPPDQTFWAQRIQGIESSEPFEMSANNLTDYVSAEISVVCTPDAVDTIRNFLPDQPLDIREITAAGVPHWAKLIHPDDIRAPSPLYVRDPDAIPAKSPLLSDLNTLSGEDLAKLAALQAASLDEAWSTESLTSMIQSQSAFGLCAFDGEACVGFSVYLPGVDDCELLSIATAPALRGKGLAKHLLDEGEKTARVAGFDRILLEVADDNLAAHTLYEQHGFSEDGRRKGYYTRANAPARDAILMSKPIK